MCSKQDCFYLGCEFKCVKCVHNNSVNTKDYYIVEPRKRNIADET